RGGRAVQRDRHPHLDLAAAAGGGGDGGRRGCGDRPATLRLRGDYLALVTLGFGEIIPQVVRNGDNMFGTGFNLTNGVAGITPIDPMGFRYLHGILPFLPDNFLLTPNLDVWFYRVGLLLVAITVFCSIRLRYSRLGRA